MKRKDVVFAVLGAFFLTNAVLAEIVGGKLIFVGPESWTLFGQRLGASVGVFLWPIVFVTTDLVNEYFGRGGVRRLTFLTVAMIGYAFFALLVAGAVPAAPFSSVGDAAFEQVFRQSRWIIVGSIAAFAVSQLVDVAIFRAVRAKTGASRIWMRATGSTVVSQIVDSVVVLYVGLAVPLGWDLRQFVVVAVPNYLIKLAIAFAMTPVIYLLHALVARYLGHDEAERIAAAAHADA